MDDRLKIFGAYKHKQVNVMVAAVYKVECSIIFANVSATLLYIFRYGLAVFLILFYSGAFSQNDSLNFVPRPEIPDSAFNDMGVSVSPSSMHLNIKPGTSVVKEIRVNNATKQGYSFSVGYCDFEMGRNGKPVSLKQSEGKYGLSKYINVSPSYFSLKPAEEVKLKVVITIPDEEEAWKALWTIITIDQIKERPPLDATDKPGRLALGINPTFGFGVYVYQNPPNVKINSAQIDKFTYYEKDGKRKVEMTVKNTGDGISYCKSYVELTNLKTGTQNKLQVKRFTILPQYFRDFYYELPSDLAPGKYSAVGVVDFGSSEEIVAAEAEFEIF